MKEVIHDCYLDITNESIADSESELISKQIPRDIVLIGEQWGWNDTEFVNEVYKWIKFNYIREIKV